MDPSFWASKVKPNAFAVFERRIHQTIFGGVFKHEV